MIVQSKCNHRSLRRPNYCRRRRRLFLSDDHHNSDHYNETNDRIRQHQHQHQQQQQQRQQHRFLFIILFVVPSVWCCYRNISIRNSSYLAHNIDSIVGVNAYIIRSTTIHNHRRRFVLRQQSIIDMKYDFKNLFDSLVSSSLYSSSFFVLCASPKQKRGGSSSGSSSSSKSNSNNNKSTRDGRRTSSTSSGSSFSSSNSKKSSKVQPSLKRRSTNTMLLDVDPSPDPLITTSTASKKSNTSNKKKQPPWNVRSTNDAKIHVEEERIRRASIQQQQQQQQQMQLSNTTNTVRPTITTATTHKSDNDPNVLQQSSSSKVLLSKVFLSSRERQFIKWKRFYQVTGGMKVLHTFYNATALQSTLQNGYLNYGVPEIAFIGRSNVGKSSLLNTLYTSMSTSSTGNSNTGSSGSKRGKSKDTSSLSLARVGKTPGATASVNMYSLYNTNSKQRMLSSREVQKDMIIFIDLPGFGYAKLSKEHQESIIRTTEQYIYVRTKMSQTLALGIVLLDIRRIPTSEDIEFIETLYNMDVSILIVVTKCDKISSKYERQQLIDNIQSMLQLPQPPLCISSKTGENINVLWQIIFDACETCVDQMKQKYDSIESSETDNDDIEDNDPIDEGYEYNDNTDGWYNENPAGMIEDDDEEEIEYNQGYDWTDNNIILEVDDDNVYTYDNNSITNHDNDNINDDDENNDDDSDDPDSQNVPIRKRVTLKTLKRRVKKMQRRGEI